MSEHVSETATTSIFAETLVKEAQNLFTLVRCPPWLLMAMARLPHR